MVDVTLVGFRVVEVPTVSPDKECWMAPAAALIPNVGFRPLDDCVVAAAGADASSATFAPDSGEGAVVQPPTGTPSLSALKLWPTAASRSGMR